MLLCGGFGTDDRVPSVRGIIVPSEKVVSDEAYFILLEYVFEQSCQP